jgi:hypothetical protein
MSTVGAGPLSFPQVVPGPSPDSPIAPRHIYAVKNDGTLLVYVDASTDTAPNWLGSLNPAQPHAWTLPAMPTVNWANFAQVFAGGDGILYAQDKSTFPGTLRYFRFTPVNFWQNPSPLTWSADSNTQIPAPTSPTTEDWGSFVQFMGVGNGIFWAVDSAGNLVFFRHGWGPNGQPAVSWFNDWYTGDRSGGYDGWAPLFFGGRLNVTDPPGFYGIKGGNLYLANLYAPPLNWIPTVAGTPLGWSDFPRVFSGGDGIIYAVDPAGQMWRFRDPDCGGDGLVDYTSHGAGLALGIRESGLSWLAFKFLFATSSAHVIEGYVSTHQEDPVTGRVVAPMSVTPGSMVRVRVSTFSDTYQIRLVQLAGHFSDPTNLQSQTGTIDGIQVSPTVTLTAPAGATSRSRPMRSVIGTARIGPATSRDGQRRTWGYQRSCRQDFTRQN